MMDIQKLLHQVEQFRRVYQWYYVETMQLFKQQYCLDKTLFAFKNQEEEKDLKLLETEMNRILPAELHVFYAEVGQLLDENQPENLTICIPSVTELLVKKGIKKWTKTATFGLVDIMKLH